MKRRKFIQVVCNASELNNLRWFNHCLSLESEHQDKSVAGIRCVTACSSGEGSSAWNEVGRCVVRGRWDNRYLGLHEFLLCGDQRRHVIKAQSSTTVAIATRHRPLDRTVRRKKVLQQRPLNGPPQRSTDPMVLPGTNVTHKY